MFIYHKPKRVHKVLKIIIKIRLGCASSNSYSILICKVDRIRFVSRLQIWSCY